MNRKIFGIVYEIALWLLAFVALPKMLYQFFINKKYRNSLAERFGKGFPHISKKGRYLIWIHAVSVGETKAVAALAKKFKEELKNPIILISSITETGHAEAKRSIPNADYHVYLPFDFLWIIRRIVNRARPDLVILCETDFWYNFLKCSKDTGATIALVNGKLSERSTRRFQSFSWFARQLFSLFDCICVQSNFYAERFAKVGISPDRLIATGNMKFDDHATQLEASELALWRQQLWISVKDQVLVIGSTHYPEEKMILDALIPLWEKCPQLKVILAPRHPERLQEVADLLQKRHLPFIRFSQVQVKSGDEKVILIDKMGLLKKAYQLASVAIVAGSYTPKVGGHNIIEPSWYGVPVLFGPWMHSQPDLLELVRNYKAGFQVSIEELAPILESLLQDQAKRNELGRGGERLVSEVKGSTDRTLNSLLPFLF